MRRHSALRSAAGFTLIEMMITTAITLVIVAGTLGAMNNAMTATDSASLMTNMNAGLRAASDIVVRDLLQVGQGLPTGRTIDVPNGTGANAIYLPGPPNMPAPPATGARKLATGAQEITAIIPGPGLGPTINGVATDVITVLQADGAFLSTITDYDVGLTALTSTSMTVDPGVDISNGGADDLHPGDLIMLTKGSSTALVQVTRVDGTQTAYFDSGDSLNLNQSAAATGTLLAHIRTAPSCSHTPCSSEDQTTSYASPKINYVPSAATRIRMITYYIDATTDSTRPRLVRRINNGSPTAYNNSSGTAVAFDIENFQVSYDLVTNDSNTNNVKMNAADLAGTGACAPDACSPNQIRKINISITGRSRTALRQTKAFFRNTVNTQVSLRSMSFIDKYK